MTVWSSPVKAGQGCGSDKKPQWAPWNCLRLPPGRELGEKPGGPAAAVSICPLPSPAGDQWDVLPQATVLSEVQGECGAMSSGFLGLSAAAGAATPLEGAHATDCPERSFSELQLLRG